MPREPEDGWFKPWNSVQNAVLLLAFCFVIALFDLNKSELASWVQAIGSIASIWAAFLIGNKQIRKQNQIREQEVASRSAAFYFVVQNAVNGVKSFGSLIDNGSPSALLVENWRKIHCQLLKNSKNSLSQLPSYQLGSYELVDSFHQICGSIDTIVARVEAAFVKDAFQEQELAFMRQEVGFQCMMCMRNWGRFEEASKTLNNVIALP
ncbi:MULTISPECIES: hypothetical protein [Pseudomonas]|uniref:hypothetical protein n=1 Tax=Pseudomonas TaxID=286 RepID=UPI0010715453|nr:MULTISPECIES: hypothetical protein [Pseudomonas]QBR32854.1 hypothetical protein E3Z29_21150 [Pseudomonas sp. S150]UZT91036.1 hypothetical protein OPS05_18145 [Pseudomonas koreensis]